MSLADLLDLLRTCPDGVDRFQAEELARSARLEDLTALLVVEESRAVVARVLAVRGDEGAVPALADAARRWPDPEVFEALADCGPAGRAELRRLGAEPGSVGEKAVTALALSVSRPAACPALSRALADLAAGEACRENRVLAEFWATRSGWLSSARRLLDEATFETELDQLVVLRLDPPAGPLELLPLPCVARLRARSSAELRAQEERRREVTRAFHEDLAGVPPAEVAPAGRNDACPCGSGRKFKKCCQARSEEDRRRKEVAERCRALQELVGFQEPPTRRPESARLLQFLSAREAGGPWAARTEAPLVRWASAFSRLILDARDPALDEALDLLEILPAEELESQDILWWLFFGLSRMRPARLGELVPALVRLGSVALLGRVAADLASRGDERLQGLLDEVCLSGRGPEAITSILDAAMGQAVGAELAEEAIPFLRHEAAADPAWQEGLEAVLEWTRLSLWRPRPGRVEFPAGVRAEWVGWLERSEETPEEVARLARRLRQLSTWPEAFDEVAEDSREPVQEERQLRTELAVRTVAELEEALRREDEAAPRVLAEQPGELFLLVGEDWLDWVLPEGVSGALAVAAAAGILATELGLGLPSALQVGSRLVLRQEGLGGRAAEAGVVARVALEEACSPAPALTVRLAGARAPGEPAPVSEDFDAVVAEKARRAGLHPLELAAEVRSRGGTLARSQPRPSLAGAPVSAVAEAATPEAEPAPRLAPPLPLTEDPVPARKALRRVLRRLLRTGKIGESHTSVDLLGRGVAGHLRGVIKDSVDLLLARGVLREKPTLVGLHTSVEPRHVAGVERFVEEGWLPEPGLAGLLGV